MSTEAMNPAVLDPPSNKQRLFVRYFTAILVDLAVLNLFAEFLPSRVVIDSFSTSLLAAVLLQVLLQLTIALEHKVAAWFNARPGGFMKFMRFFSAWLILFGSKFVILEALTFVFGEKVQFLGRFHGVVVLIAVIIAMLVAEYLIVRIYRKLGG